MKKSVAVIGMFPGHVMDNVLQHLRNNDENPHDISVRTDSSDRAIPGAARTDNTPLNQYF